MCGICGYLSSPASPPPSRELLREMVGALRHRGPDHQSVEVQGQLGLGHARLSIIDLEGGHQPLTNEDGNVTVVCNGEIYNYRELTQKLVAAGHRFKTASDCEVLVHLWEEHGPKCVEHLRGMFAFVIHDARTGELFGARDFFGQKPLYYFHDAQRFAFASQIKSLLKIPGLSRELDLTAVDQFLFYKYVPHPRTMFCDVKQLPPGSCFLWSKGRLQVDRYWKPEFAPDEFESHDSHMERIEAGLTDAVRSHLVSDVPLGVFLSGGIDSSLMTALATRLSGQTLQSFSIAFPETEADESQYAQLASRHFNTKHEVVSFVPSKVQETLERLAVTFDQPLADSAALPLFTLAERAAQSVKVVLTGDGGDEVFGGYRKYRRAANGWANSLMESSIAARLFDAEKLAACRSDSFGVRRLQSRVGMLVRPTMRSAYHRQHWEGWDRHRLYSEALRAHCSGRSIVHAPHRRNGDLNALNAMLEHDQLNYLPDDLLLKTDCSTMAHGLEARAPLLDHRLAEDAGRLPTSLKVTSKKTKVALRRIAEKLLPRELAERPKKGFTFPIRRWFRNELRPWARECLLESSTVVPELFNRSHVAEVLAEHESGKRDHGGRIYSLVTLELWYRSHFLA